MILCFRYFVDEDILSKVPSMFYMLAGIYSAMQIVGVLCLFQSPDSGYFTSRAEESESLMPSDAVS